MTIKIGDIIILEDWFRNTAEIYVRHDYNAVLRFKGGALDGDELKGGAYKLLHIAEDFCYKVAEHKTV